VYVLTGSFSISWVGDGVGSLSVPSAQTLKVSIPRSQAGQVPVPGGDAPSTANISTACTTAATALAAQLNANIGQIQGFATGGN
jgi:hypothetical protein